MRSKARQGREKAVSVWLIGLLVLGGCSSSGGGGEMQAGTAPVAISTESLPVGDHDLPYSASLATSESSSVTWAVTSGGLPPGLTLSPAGVIFGSPTQHGTWVITIGATGQGGNDSKTFTLVVRPKTSLVSIGSAGTKSTGDSGIHPTYGGESALSGDGEFVVFQSVATNLVLGDTNGKRDFFLHDRRNGTVSRVSIGNNGTEADGDTIAGTISDDGSTVAYQSLAANLVLGDGNAAAPGGGGGDVFTYDRLSGEVTRVSVVSLSGLEGTCGTAPSGGVPCTSFDPALTPDGGLVAFGSTFDNLVAGDTNNVADIFLHNRASKLTERVSIGMGGIEADGGSGNPGVSADGRYVVFESVATNLVGAGNDINGFSDIFVHDRLTGTTVLVSKTQAGAQGNWHSFTPSISRDGKTIAFWSVADNLVANDTNSVADVFVVDWQSVTPTMRRISVSASGLEGNGDSRVPVLSADGRYVTFESEASNLLDGGGDTNGFADIFVVDLQAVGPESIKRVSISGDGAESVGGVSHTPSISANGQFISFSSSAANLVEDDTNGVADVFVAQRP